MSENQEKIEEPKVTIEETMSPPPYASTIQAYYPKSSGNIEDILLQLIDLNSNNVLHEPTCMICSASNREEVEKKWIENKNHEETKKIFTSKNSMIISNDVIDNHMQLHYNRGIKELQKIEYANKIKRLNSVELTTLDRIRLGLSMLTERLMGINSITPSNDIAVAEVEKIKSAETSRIMASFNQLLKLQASILGEMKNNGELIMIPRQSFVDTFNKAIVNSKTNEERETIKHLLTSLAEISKKTQ